MRMKNIKKDKHTYFGPYTDTYYLREVLKSIHKIFPQTNQTLKHLKIERSKKNSITIVLCAKGYPSNYIKDSEIKNLPNVLIDKNNQIFHAGTYEKNNKTYSSGGRVLNITSSSESLAEARNRSLTNINKINWPDGFFRKDIGWRVIDNK